jgi:methylated-DNA-[protein]-cysteine S-methyltransferase
MGFVRHGHLIIEFGHSESEFRAMLARVWPGAILINDAKALRQPRAVGHANGSNPLPIVIPCHRLIGSNGGLCGYGGGIELKRKLVELEGRQF